MNALFSISERIGTFLAGVCCVILAFIAVSTVVDVTIRELGYQSFTGRTALAEWGLLYTSMLGAPYLVRTGGHVFVDALLQAMPSGVRLILEKLIYLLCICICVYLGVFSFQLGYEGWKSGDFEARSFDMPRWLIYLPLVIGFLLAAVEFLRYLIGHASMYNRKPTDQDAQL